MSLSYSLCEDFGRAVRLAWEADSPLIEKYHIRAGEGIEACVKDTVDTLKNCEDLKFYDVYFENELFGFFATEKFKFGGFITTFFIYPNFRSKKNKKDFVSLMIKHFDKETDIYSSVFGHNIRAVRFLEEHGFQVIEIGMEKETLFYVFKYI